jgi:uncharacterized OB-fold protein
MSEETVTALTPARWWEALDEGRLLLLSCGTCGVTWLPWIPNCPDCGPGTPTREVASAGRGRVYSWVGIHHSASMPEDVPFTILSVRLDEGAMVYGRFSRDTTPVAEQVVRLCFIEANGRRHLAFRPDRGGQE